PHRPPPQSIRLARSPKRELRVSHELVHGGAERSQELDQVENEAAGRDRERELGLLARQLTSSQEQKNEAQRRQGDGDRVSRHEAVVRLPIWIEEVESPPLGRRSFQGHDRHRLRMRVHARTPKCLYSFGERRLRIRLRKSPAPGGTTTLRAPW